VHPSPFPYADVVTTTTHKTLRGPRGAIIFSKDREISAAIRKAVFPGMQGGPHDNQTFAIAVALKEAMSPKFKTYASQIVKNAKVLAQELFNYRFHVCGAGTENHLMLLDVTPLGMTGKDAERKLYEAGIVVNRNAIPFDMRPAYDPSGIRLGTPAATTRGFKEKEMRQIATWMQAVLMQKAQTKTIRKQVSALTKKFPLPY
jgi:glycine hydroxymethyltransferase